MALSILCVDDDPALLKVYANALSPHFQVFVAENAQAGLALIASGPAFAAVIADKSMPGMNGIEFLDLVRQRLPGCLRIMLTGINNDRATIDALNQGKIQRLLLKPCSMQLLERVIHEGLAAEPAKLPLPDGNLLRMAQEAMGKLRVNMGGSKDEAHGTEGRLP